MVLRIVENISLSSILYKYELCWSFFTTYFEVIVAATLGKSSHSKSYLNEAMASGSYISINNVATYKTIKRTELTTVKLPLSFETHNHITHYRVGG